ncbi:MAG: M20/M25/M40 family metallo-hydrolase [Pirellulales bacterium]|nr:M20/M25/M40 family metallo-hydrolase [Pirellulales bacterium]
MSKVKKNAALELALELMAIPGPPGAEAEVAKTISDKLLAAGAPAGAIQSDTAHRRTPVKGDTGNFVLKLPGTHKGPRRLLMAHMDTVPLCVGSRPVVRGRLVHSRDKHTGLGADNRAGCAVVLHTAIEILTRKLPHPPLTFLWTVQEEVGLHGARLLKTSMLGKPRLAFNWDGGSPEKLTIGATGGYRIAIEIGGIASHAGGAPEEGVNAITIAGLAIADLQANGWLGLIEKGRGVGTSNIGVIEGGAATNVVTDRVTIRAEARSHDPKFRKRIVAAIEKAFERAAKAVTNDAGECGNVKFDGRTDYESFKLKLGEPCVRAAKDAIEQLGGEPEFAIANGGLDANWMNAHGIPTVSMGCGQLNIHTVSEQLDIANFRRACEIAMHLATDGAAT